MTFKIKVHQACIQLLEERIKFLQATLNDLTAGAVNDAKSSAGDKHETGRAMMQLEHEKISRQLSDTLVQKSFLDQLKPEIPSAVVAAGSLVKTNNGYIYLSIALGKIVVGQEQVIVLSLQSPLGQKLAGRKANSSAEINGTHYLIKEVF
jgi:hypothetical protein